MPDFRLRDDFAPGTPGNVCYLCKSCQRGDEHDREAVVDPHTHIEWEGPLQFCESCVVEMGRLIGMMTPADVERARDIVIKARAETDQLRSERDDLRTALDALTRARYEPASVEPVPIIPKSHRPTTNPEGQLDV